MTIKIFLIGLIFVVILMPSLKVEALESKTIETTYGTVEYSCEGTGEPVLVVHGIFGGVDQAIQTGKNLIGKNFKIIGVSRFGYLKSTLPENSTPVDQAAAYKELLDKLQIKEVFVLAASAGGAPSIKFALKYPERTKGLILVGSDSPSQGEIKGPTGPPSFLLNDFIFRIALFKPFRGLMRSSLFGIEKDTYRNASQNEKEQLDRIFELLLPVKSRKPGIINDTKITNLDMNKNYNKYVLEDMKVPTLVFHAKNDPMASFERAQTMAERIPDSQFIEFKKGGHLLFGHQKEIQEKIKKFINEDD